MASVPETISRALAPKAGALLMAAGVLALSLPVAASAQEVGSLTPAMVEAGAAALGGSGAGDPGQTATRVFSAMFDVSWRPIATAPKNGSDILLGIWKGDQFVYGLGRWVVNDDIAYPGFWSPMDWFGGEPTLWAPLPPTPSRP